RSSPRRPKRTGAHAHRRAHRVRVPLLLQWGARSAGRRTRPAPHPRRARSSSGRATRGHTRLHRMAISDRDSTESKLDRLQQLRDEAEHAGTEEAVERQRRQGKLLAGERLVELLDPGSFVELDRYVRHRESNFGMLERRPYGDAVVTGYGTIFGRKVFVFS